MQYSTPTAANILALADAMAAAAAMFATGSYDQFINARAELLKLLEALTAH
jgi:hypothetical protein